MKIPPPKNTRFTHRHYDGQSVLLSAELHLHRKTADGEWKIHKNIQCCRHTKIHRTLSSRAKEQTLQYTIYQ